MRVDADMATRFLTSLYRNCEMGMVNIRILPGGKNYFINVNEIDRVKGIIIRHEKQNISFGAALRSGQDGTKEGVYQIPAVWLDHDNVMPEIEKRIQEFSLLPSLVVQTSLPEKRHCYWLFKEPLGKKDIGKVEELNRRLARYFDGDANACDASRVLRLPGTLNHKTAPPSFCKVLEQREECAYGIEDFEMLPVHEESKAAAKAGWHEDVLQGVPKGERNPAAASLIGRYLRKGLSPGEIFDTLRSWNQRNTPPLDESELRDVIENVAKTHERQQGKGAITQDAASQPKGDSVSKAKRETISERKEFPGFPPTAWVGIAGDYLKLVGSCTESPDSFHFAAITSVLGLILGRKFYIKHPHPVYQNYYFLVVGTSALYHKGTAIRFAEDVCEELGEGIKAMQILVSSEGIFTVLAKEPGTRLLVVNDEMRTLFANARRAGTQNLLSNLCTLYDPKRFLTVGQKNTLEIKEGLMSMVSAATTEWISETPEIEAALGGFLNRNLVVAGEIKDPISDPQPPADAKRQAFIEEIKEWRKALPPDGGMIKKPPAVMAFYDDYYNSWFKEIHSMSGIPQTLKARESHHVIKLASLFALENTRMEISREDVERAIAVAEHSSKCQLILFKDIDIQKTARLENKMLALLEKGPMKKRDLLRKTSTGVSCGEKGKIIDNLQRAGLIETKGENNPRGSRTEWCSLVEQEEGE